MAILESGHAANRVYTDQDGNIHLNGALLYRDEVGTALSATTANIVPIAGSTTITQAAHGNKTVYITSSTVSLTCTLPSMTGSGVRYRIVCGASLSSATVTITATGAYLFGSLVQNNDTGGTGLFGSSIATNASGSTNITLNGSTQGGRKADWIDIEDVATNVGIVSGMVNGSGTEATPFS